MPEDTDIMSTKAAIPRLGSPTARFGERLQSWIRSVREYRQQRRERDQLLALSDRELRDIGLSRVDAIREATKPLRTFSFRHARESGHPENSTTETRRAPR
ncbi:MAG TPA: DUF1127 domain-containing protein [Alphaproteobacteria bacterium]